MFVLLKDKHLTIKQTVKMETLQILSLSHEAIQRSGPAFSQHLHPLHVHLGTRGLIQGVKY